MIRRLLASAAVACLLPLSVSAQGVTDREIAPQCRQTPSLATSGYPGFARMLPHNRLAMPAGKAVAADGQLVYLYGRVFDRNCVPLSDASVEIWQLNPQGSYTWPSAAALATPDPVFSSGGRIRTDNLGQFHFLTLYPGAAGRNAPYIQMRVTHPSLRSFNTRLYFTGDYRNLEDPTLTRLSEDGRELVTMLVMPRMNDWQQGVQAYVDVVLPQAAPFRKY
jgi:protocatechuate 3,4-dioxygenase beta subunit